MLVQISNECLHVFSTVVYKIIRNYRIKCVIWSAIDKTLHTSQCFKTYSLDSMSEGPWTWHISTYSVPLFSVY